MKNPEDAEEEDDIILEPVDEPKEGDDNPDNADNVDPKEPTKYIVFKDKDYILRVPSSKYYSYKINRNTSYVCG